jgi:hypothetical protein
MTTQQFHLGDLLSITTDRMLAPWGMKAITHLLNHMTGDTLQVFQLPLAADAMRPELLQQHPWLTGLTPPEGDDKAALLVWFDRAIARHGEHHDVEPAPLGWGTHDPIQDFINYKSLVARDAAMSTFAGLSRAFQEAGAAAQRAMSALAHLKPADAPDGRRP